MIRKVSRGRSHDAKKTQLQVQLEDQEGQPRTQGRPRQEQRLGQEKLTLRALSLPDTVVERVRAGYPEVRLEELPAAQVAAQPGRPLHLVDGRGQVVASGLADPENEIVRVLSREEVTSFDADFFRRRVRQALHLRQTLGLVDDPRETAYRLVNGEGDGLSGFVADVYGEYVVLYAYSRGLLQAGRIVAQAVLDLTVAKGVVLKVRPKGGQRPGKVEQEILGERPAAKQIALELGVPYEVHLLTGLNAGLFTDMREQRRGLARFVRHRRVLNTFAYTGALSVAAARAGAETVTSVDLSSGVLKWARENFRLAGFDPEEPRFRFEVSDVPRFLAAAARAGEEYDAIVLDPPTYSAARASAWSMKQDYPKLIAQAARLLPPRGGFLWVSANSRRAKDLPRHISAAMKLCEGRARVLEIGGLPPDYPTPVDYPKARYLEVYYLAVERGSSFPECAVRGPGSA